MIGWYIIRTIPQLENRVAIELRDAGFAYYLPKERKWGQRRRDKSKVAIVRTLFPGYLFVAIDFPRQSFHDAKVFGVHELLGQRTGLIPRQIPAKLVLELMKGEINGKFDKARPKQLPELREGESVKITEGPFAGFPALVARTSREKRVELLVMIFGRDTPVIAERDQFETAA